MLMAEKTFDALTCSNSPRNLGLYVAV
uniref:Uncharacterized protein n=1 Tax=Anguilla anguilla TaxID=7936 RepID=A0A0E9V5A1_ANGAN